MHSEVKKDLQEIGFLLDENNITQIRVHNYGIVQVQNGSAQTSTSDEEKKNERQESSRPATQPRKRPFRWQRPAFGSWKACRPAPVVSTELREQYLAELNQVCAAYPGAKVWHQTNGLWLITESLLLRGNWQKAHFVTWIPFIRTWLVRSWGFWFAPPLKDPIWIGPRHTNSPDGSVCAFEPKDGTWVLGDPLFKLLDLFTLWALRHIHLQELDLWPGRQVGHYAFERLTEFRKDEYCGCGLTDKRYGDCCWEKDFNSDREAEMKLFFNEMGWIPRMPPADVVSFIQKQTVAPVFDSSFI